MNIANVITPHTFKIQRKLINNKMKKHENIDLKNYVIDPNVLNEIPLNIIEKNNIIPIKIEKMHSTSQRYPRRLRT